MTSRLAALLLPGLLAVLAAFVWRSASDLPAVVASQFGAGGAAIRFMARDTYVALMLGLVVGVPLLVAILPTALAGGDGSHLNLPHRDHWLSPERREGTRTFIRRHGQWSAAISALFLGYVHYLVVQANQRQPPTLATTAMAGGVVVLLMLLAIGLAVFWTRFRRPA
jgi:hypothetical protein